MRELSNRWEKNTSDHSPHESESSKKDNAEFSFGSKGNILPMLQSVDLAHPQTLIGPCWASSVSPRSSGTKEH